MSVLNQLRIMEESMWRQKLRNLLLKEWDRNTSYFHKMVSNRRWFKNIKPQMVGLSEDTSVEELKRRVSQAFKSRFSMSNNGVHILSWDMEFPKVDRERWSVWKGHFLRTKFLKS